MLSKAFRSQFRVFQRGKWLGDFTLNVPGKHNISNATGVIALATELGVSVEKIAEAFESFRGARRRFEVKYRSDNYMVVDDYGHHPSEIRATLATARGVTAKRVWVMFQPHRYTRTLALKEEFATAFKDADGVFVADIYPASEKPIPGVSGADDRRCDEGGGADDGVFSCPTAGRFRSRSAACCSPGDLILSLGAGDIHEQGAAIASRSRARRGTAKRDGRRRGETLRTAREDTRRCASAAPRKSGWSRRPRRGLRGW